MSERLGDSPGGIDLMFGMGPCEMAKDALTLAQKADNVKLMRKVLDLPREALAAQDE